MLLDACAPFAGSHPSVTMGFLLRYYMSTKRAVGFTAKGSVRVQKRLSQGPLRCRPSRILDVQRTG